VPHALLAGQARRGHGRGKFTEITRPRTGAAVNRYTTALSTQLSRAQHHMAAPGPDWLGIETRLNKAPNTTTPQAMATTTRQHLTIQTYMETRMTSKVQEQLLSSVRSKMEKHDQLVVDGAEDREVDLHARDLAADVMALSRIMRIDDELFTWARQRYEPEAVKLIEALG